MIGIMLAGTIAGAGVVGWSMRTAMHELRTDWQQQNYMTITKSLARQGLHDALGYGGFIHNFNTYTLGRDDRLVPLLQRDLIRAREGIAFYRNLRVSQAERDALARLEAVIERYAGALDAVRSAIANDRSSLEVADLARVDDQAALDALDFLQNVLTQEQWAAIDASADSISHLLQLLVLATLIVPVLITTGVAILWLQRRLVLAFNESVRQRCLLQAIFDSAPDAMVITDDDQRIAFCNAAAAGVFGHREEALQGRAFADLFAADAEAEHCTAGAAPCPDLGGGCGSSLFRYRRQNGEEFFGETRCRPVVDEFSDTAGWLCLVRDVTEREATRKQLIKLSQAVEQSSASVIITDPAGIIEYVNPKFTEMTGYEAGEALGRAVQDILPDEEHKEVDKRLWATLRAGRPWRGELEAKRKTGDRCWRQVSISPIFADDGRITHYVAVEEDITLRKQYEDRLIVQATTDMVTALPNRVLAADRLAQALSRGRRQGLKTAMLFIDLDHFKNVNDTFGHAGGDLLLQLAGKRIRQCVREVDTVARLGGDEFAVILPELHVSGDAERVACKILNAFASPFQIIDGEVMVTTSIGITIAPDDGDDPAILMRNADAAMYRVKNIGRNSFEFFTESLNQQIKRRLGIERQLHLAQERGEFMVHFQPIVSAKTGAVLGAESLLRWRNAELGFTAPQEFIAVAEDTGRIVGIGEWVLRQVCRQFRTWLDDGLPLQRISVNVSGRQLRSPAFVDTVRSALDGCGLPAENMELEITEGVLLTDLPDVWNTLHRLHEIGVRLSLDDFGTGCSSLSHLRRFPVDTLKIDRSFIRDLDNDPADVRLVEAIIALGHRLDLEIVAEGVETASQLKFLQSAGCDLIQGYFYSAPLPAVPFAESVRRGTTALAKT